MVENSYFLHKETEAEKTKDPPSLSQQCHVTRS